MVVKTSTGKNSISVNLPTAGFEGLHSHREKHILITVFLCKVYTVMGNKQRERINVDLECFLKHVICRLNMHLLECS